ncbi:MAG TPA: TraB/GumN family protein, partial [Chitinophagaceae bacterium]|nr:TraB/GumN family protein [Chitinophagaceae bacterium]
MKRSLLFFLLVVTFIAGWSQPVIKNKKYPSLLWEITGPKLKQPSYLIGTMHVSNKLAFHLSDSFYNGIKNAQVVALETNPESWQEDMSKYDFGSDKDMFNRFRAGDIASVPNEYLSLNTLKFYKYDKKIERSLYSSPSTINNLLYRTYGNESSDFEEDTYLDMYIFQCGKKWGKNVTGVENYGESMRLMSEAYKDAAKDKNKKDRSFDREEGYSSDKIQEAYRSGNLDLLDSINRYNSFSDAFDEKFLYRRNQIQAGSIDSILRSGSTLFVGVGAAHLPGSRGVIEILRSKGYILRPVRMTERDSRDKDQVEKLRVPVVFKTEKAEDGLFSVDIPGKFYKFGDDAALDQRQYADMANGSYYMVTRIMTNAWMWGHNMEDVYRIVDSLLYENIPGKILTRTEITKNGYKGFDITNRTRRGDLQRYNIFITPFEILFFKMSGNGDYVKNGDEAKRFFGSIKLLPYQPSAEVTNWKKYSPPYGGFSIDLPHEPYIGNDGSWIYDAADHSTGNYYRVIRSDIHNYHFVEEDSFDLGLMDESFRASEFIDELVDRHLGVYKGYPVLDCKYKDKKGDVIIVRYLIQGPHYYTLVAKGKIETIPMRNFLNSFEIRPFEYPVSKTQKDTSLYFSVNTPVFPEDKKIKLDMPSLGLFGLDDDEDEESEDDILAGGTYRNKVISNDTTGEKIYVSFNRFPKYYYIEDSALLGEDEDNSNFGDTSMITRYKSNKILASGMKVNEVKLSDKGSSRLLWKKTYYKNGINFMVETLTDTLTKPSLFLQNFFESFTAADTLQGVDPYSKKSGIFFQDFMSTDTSLHKRAVKQIDDIDLDSSDFPALKKAINGLNWNEKKYLDTKKELINKLGDIPTAAADAYMKELYFALGDTIQLQYAVLDGLVEHQTPGALAIFRDIVKSDPPVLEVGSSSGYSFPRRGRNSIYGSSGSYSNNFLDDLADTIQLTKTILPDLLPLLEIEDYKKPIMRLLGVMVDSGIVKPGEYERYYNKFLLEARLELKKQVIAEKTKAIEKAEDNKPGNKNNQHDEDEDDDGGNDELELLATLLLPFNDQQPAVLPVLRQMLQSSDKKLKYATMLLLMRNNKPIPDTMLNYFAGMDDYRYRLFTRLKKLNKIKQFPAAFNNHLDLGRSALLDKKSYGKPDSLVYIDRLAATFKDKKGFIYFYKYKARKDDISWKLATVGLVPEDPAAFEFEEEDKSPFDWKNFSLLDFQWFTNKYDFTSFSDTKLKEDESLQDQLNKALKKL